ncbi:hypothetical protein [Gordonia aurantiaca]|uniref:hypothetical protein n=1 Tax=Gordonia sp. B21 TaxID=3151852 RepID=UPI003264A8DA
MADPDRSRSSGPGSQRAGSPDSGSPQTHADPARRRRGLRWNQYLGRTTIRLSSVVLFVVFIACCLLYGYTSQRYGVVEPQPARPAPRTSQIVEEPEYTEPVPSSTEILSESTSESPSPGEPGAVEEGPGGTSSPGEGPRTAPSTTRQTVPGLPGVEIPNFAPQTPTTPVPTR